jgi:hypothetical protein
VADKVGVVKLAEFVPTGVVVVPEAPWYHWYVNGAVPDATTLSVAVAPLLMVVETGLVVIEEATATLTAAVLELAKTV